MIMDRNELKDIIALGNFFGKVEIVKTQGLKASHIFAKQAKSIKVTFRILLCSKDF
jgi:hypothetical protein